MASDSTRFIAVAALVLAGCAIGIVIGRWTVEPAPAQPAPFEHSSALVDLTPIVSELRRANDAVLEAVRERAPTNSKEITGREPAFPDANVLTKLVAAIERNNTHLERADAERQAQRTTQAKLKGPGYPSLDAMFDQMQQMVGVGESAEWMENIGKELRVKHMAWTRDDLLDRYGAPAAIHGSDRGVSFFYERRTSNDRRSVNFLTSEGLVTEAYFH